MLVFTKKSVKSRYHWARKGTVFYGYCWGNNPTWNWTPVRHSFNGRDYYVWHTQLRAL
ncbi:hypothetical protein ACIBHX_33360 [Nonomuraea sp. NPDC050536]|uniref:hypothetical protein n=1 Tax=Nonomuraea sp. NPDC050536 TaxID=3364366 RepID=UPI0037C9B33E